MATCNSEIVVSENSTVIFFLTFPDEEGNNAVPNTITWSLYKEAGQVVNGRLDVEEPFALEVPVVLQGADLALERGKSPWRTLVVKATIDTTLGVNLPLTSSIRFRITNLQGE